jgi:hypothetical protein
MDTVTSVTVIDADKSIKPFEVFRKLSRIYVHKSPGPDDIPNWVLREFAFAIF